MRPGVTIPLTKVKAKDNKIGVKSVKMKKVSKSDVKIQMKGKSIITKGKTAKNIVKVKSVKKKWTIVILCCAIEIVEMLFSKL